MKISDNARAVLERRYLKKDAGGKLLESPEDMLARVAKAVAAADGAYGGDVAAAEREFFGVMDRLEFLPNSPTLMNAGRPLGQLSACFVLPVGDSMEEIFDAIKQAALIHKSGGGTGFAFSRLRPAGSIVGSTGGVASGPISFMKVFNAATEAVKQGGTRRGANMGILRVDHPDILHFISCKEDTSEITNFNISIGLTETFMEQVKSGGDYELINPKTKEVVGTLNAAAVFEKIVNAAWRTGEPGIIFLDRMNAGNPVPAAGEIESTNPCGEQPLLPYESCNLGSINLLAMRDAAGTGVDWDKLRNTIHTAVHFLDNVIEINAYPLDIIGETTKKTRKIGLGVMGFADLLLELGIPYGGEAAVALAEELMRFINDEGHRASAKLAETRPAFPLFSESVYKDGPKLRNATVTTIAPTGTLSIIAGVSSGIEPVFGYVYVRNVMDNDRLLEVNSTLKRALEKRGILGDDLLTRIAEAGTLHDIDGIPDDIRRVFVSAHDIDPKAHITMQAAFQKYTDNAVSKTVNFPHDATAEKVAEVFRLAYTLGCKGVTIYRDGSRDSQVLSLGSAEKAADGNEADPAFACDDCALLQNREPIQPRPRPESAMGFTEKVKIGCGNLYITVNYDDKGILEVFTNNGKKGGCPSQSEATSRLATAALRSGVDPQYIVKQLRGIRCPSTLRQNGTRATSCPDAISRVVEKALAMSKRFREDGPLFPEEDDPTDGGRLCPECGEVIEHEGGCVICRNCGFSKCG